jgi:hypothetical protein
MRKGMLGLTVLTWMVFELSGCMNGKPEETPPSHVPDFSPTRHIEGLTPADNAPDQQGADPFRKRLLEIAAEYASYGRVDKELNWGPMLCAPFGVAQSPAEKTRPPEQEKLRVSSSGDSGTHGRKLYFVFARQAYRSLTPGYSGRSYITGIGVIDYRGQVIVKESWIPEEVTHGKPGHVEKTSQEKLPTELATRNGRTYRAARKGELFIMYKLDPKTPGTDNGWVYGVVSADGKQVLNAGRIENCMKCHQDAPHDHLFGLPEEQSPSGK